VKRLAAVAALAIACGSNVVQRTAGPLNTFFYPTGIAVLNHRLVVASSNADLSYDSATGGTVISVVPQAFGCDPQTDPTCRDVLAGGLNIESFAGEAGIADPAACPALAAPSPEHPAGRGPAGIVPIRGTNNIYRLDLAADGVPACDGCKTPVGTTDRGDPWAVGIACDTSATPNGPTIARAFVGYLRASLLQGWITQIDLTKDPTQDGYAQTTAYLAGGVRSFAYDSSRKRIYYTHAVTGGPATLAFVDLANDCRIDVAFSAGGCSAGQSATDIPTGLELEGIALSNETGSTPTASVRRAYLTARIYDAVAAQATGARVGDFDGLLLVVDLFEDATGTLRVQILDQVPIGYGASYVRVLPKRSGLRDVVAAMAADDGVVWIYDDETGTRVALGRDPATGAPVTGQGPFALGVDPAALPGTNVARVYVGSFREHFVTPIDVPLDNPAAAAIPVVDGNLRRIVGGVTP
jgi:hypothetical protein